MAVWNVIDHQETGSGGDASYSKSSIGTSYDHLYFTASTRISTSAIYTTQYIEFNSDTGTNYTIKALYAIGGTVYAGSSNSGNNINYVYAPSATADADIFGSLEVWIPNYANTDNYKQALCTWGFANGSAANNILGSTGGLWMSTAAIDTFKLAAGSGTFDEYSTYTLYGINGAA